VKYSFHSVIALTVLLAGAAAPADAQDRVERIQFAKGAHSKAIRGRVVGSNGVAYVVAARAGQTVTADLSTSNGSNYFNITAAGSDEALFIGSTSGNSYRGTIPVTGDYRIQVYLMRNAARRHEVAKYTLTVTIAVSGAGTATIGSHDANVAGTKYQATASIGCAIGAGVPLGQCKAGVMRSGPGEATVEITLPGDGQRHIYFHGTRATSSDSPAGGFVARKDADLNVITAGDKERYEFPDAFVSGG
jgi:hypothetical protein